MARAHAIDSVCVVSTSRSSCTPDGKQVFTDNGQIQFEILIDHGGTPTDSSDDEELALLGVVKGSTGTNGSEGRDFCDDIHHLTG